MTLKPEKVIIIHLCVLLFNSTILVYSLPTHKLTTLKTSGIIIENPRLKINDYLYRQQFLSIVLKSKVSHALKQCS